MAFLVQQARRVAWSSPKSTESNGKPEVRRLSRSAAPSAFVEALEQDGCVIVKDFTDKATLQQADDEVRPWLEREGGGATVGGMLDFFQCVDSI